MAGCCGEELLLLWCSLELGRPREGRTAADRESKEKREHWCWGRGFRCALAVKREKEGK